MASGRARGAPFSMSRGDKHALVCTDCACTFFGAYVGKKQRKRCDSCTKAHLAATEKARRAAKSVEIRAYYTSPKGRWLFLKYRAKKAGLALGISVDQLASILDDSCCYYCSGPLSETGFALDRVDNSLGYVPDNVVPCCPKCNMDKKTMSQTDYLAVIRNRVDEGLLERD